MTTYRGRFIKSKNGGVAHSNQPQMENESNNNWLLWATIPHFPCMSFERPIDYSQKSQDR